MLVLAKQLFKFLCNIEMINSLDLRNMLIIEMCILYLVCHVVIVVTHSPHVTDDNTDGKIHKLNESYYNINSLLQ